MAGLPHRGPPGHNRGMSPAFPAAATFLPHLSRALDALGFWEGPAVLAVSGGADSVALLHGVVRVLADRDDAPAVTVAHAHHDLRGSAARDAEFVAALAAAAGLPCRIGAVAVRSAADGGEGLEGIARRLRYRFLLAVARECGAVSVVVAHTADDQAETILHRIARGTGLVGLAGMPARRRLGDGVDLIRPLLDMPGATPRAFLGERGLAWCEDESNADRRFSRNYLRHEVLPRLAAGPYPSASAALIRLGRQAGAAAALIASVARGLLDAHATKRDDGTVVIDATGLAGCDPHLVAEVFAVLWRREGWPRRHMGQAHYARLADLVAAAGRGQVRGAADFPGGITAGAERGRPSAVVIRRRRPSPRHAPDPTDR